mmetsp:Transcript_36427/g.113505  ORF Transcript_36427/g.113505 Transcript_36427/m.113505 type:complete len:216 (+) Transcript_36427:450-1097(+)
MLRHQQAPNYLAEKGGKLDVNLWIPPQPLDPIVKLPHERPVVPPCWAPAPPVRVLSAEGNVGEMRIPWPNLETEIRVCLPSTLVVVDNLLVPLARRVDVDAPSLSCAQKDRLFQLHLLELIQARSMLLRIVVLPLLLLLTLVLEALRRRPDRDGTEPTSDPHGADLDSFEGEVSDRDIEHDAGEGMVFVVTRVRLDVLVDEHIAGFFFLEADPCP